ncbi:MAG TPA: response regulator transcription factor [Methylomirabilota bacterium]|nr:response regulator transcription factor [Methylomirabilota bacterium]
MTVAIVEDDESIRSSLALLIDGAAGFRCVSTHANAEAALARLPHVKPDVVLMDIQLPGLSGVECVRKLKTLLPRTQTIMLTAFEDDEQVFQSLAAGACGYLLKRSRPSAILEAIDEVHRGGSPMSSHIARKVVQSFQSGPRTPAGQATAALSDREREILGLLAQGYRYKEIADRLQIAVDTVRSHLRRIYEKLHVHSRTEAVVKFLGK